MQASIIIASYNRCDILARTLPPLLQQADNIGQVEILLIDDASPVDYSWHLRQWGFWGRVKYVKMSQNVGQSAAQAHGAMQASGELLIFLDDDLEICDGFLESHLSFHSEMPMSLLNGVQLIPHSAELDSFARYRAYKDNQVFQSIEGFNVVRVQNAGLTNANLSVKRTDYFKIGPFKVSSSQRLASVDYEFGWRARNLGYRVYCDPRVRTYHHDANIEISRYLRRMHEHGFAHADLPRISPAMASDPVLAQEYEVRGPVRLQDSLVRKLKKTVLRTLALTPIIFLTAVIARLALRLKFPDWCAFRLYELAVQAHYQAGYNSGLKPSNNCG